MPIASKHSRCWLVFLAATASGALVPADAVNAKFSSGSATSDECLNAKDDMALRECRLNAVSRQMAHIQKVTDELINRASDEGGLQQAIRVERTSWLKYRDAQCKVDTWESLSSTSAEVELLYCEQKLNIDRIRILDERASTP